MATYTAIARANDKLKDRMKAIADEWNRAYQKKDNETYSIKRSGRGKYTYYVLAVDYHDDNGESEISLYRCSNCDTIATEGEIESPECTNCWQKWEH